MAVVERSFRLLQLGEIERRHLKLLPGSFTVAGGDDRRLNVEESSRLKETVDRRTEGVPHASDRAEGIGSRAEMGLLAKELHRVALLLERVRRRIGRSQNLQAPRVNLDPLALAERFFDLADDGDARAGVDLLDERSVVGDVRIDHDLHVGEATAVVDFEEREVLLGLAFRADPASHINGCSGLNLTKNLNDFGARHDGFDPSKEGGTLEPVGRSFLAHSTTCKRKRPSDKSEGRCSL